MPVILWALFILLLMGVPGSYIPRVITFNEWISPDKLVHIFLFSIFVYFLIRSFNSQYYSQFIRYHSKIIALIFGIIFGALTEILQHFIFIGRNGNYFDFLADMAGCLIGLAIYLIFNLKIMKKVKG